MSEMLGSRPHKAGDRDAVHVAIVACVVDEGRNLYPGDRVVVDGGTARRVSSGHVGIVDPFLPVDFVRPGEMVWVCLLPGSVTGMRHHWQHPAFADESPACTTREASEQWLREFCRTADCPRYEILMLAINGASVDPEDFRYRIDDEYFFFGGIDAHADIPPEFWMHVENVTGEPCRHRPRMFTCSC